MPGPRSFLVLQLLLLALVFAVQAQRKPVLLGGITDADAGEEGVQKALSFAVRQFNMASNDKYLSQVFQVLRVRKQLVAEVKYFIEAEIRRTTCTKTGAELSNCPAHENPPLKKHSICEFEVYTIPWTGKTTLLKNECRDA